MSFWDALSPAERMKCFDPKLKPVETFKIHGFKKHHAWDVTGPLLNHWKTVIHEFVRVAIEQNKFKFTAFGGTSALEWTLYLVGRKPRHDLLRPTIVTRHKNIEIAEKASEIIRNLRDEIANATLDGYVFRCGEHPYSLELCSDPTEPVQSADHLQPRINGNRKSLCGAHVVIQSVQRESGTRNVVGEEWTHATVGGVIFINDALHAVTSAHAFPRELRDDALRVGEQAVFERHIYVCPPELELRQKDHLRVERPFPSGAASVLQEHFIGSADSHPSSDAHYGGMLIDWEKDWAAFPILNKAFDAANKIGLANGDELDVYGCVADPPSEPVIIASGVSKPSIAKMRSSPSVLLLPGSSRPSIAWAVNRQSMTGDSGSWVLDQGGRVFGMVLASSKDITFCIQFSDILAHVPLALNPFNPEAFLAIRSLTTEISATVALPYSAASTDSTVDVTDSASGDGSEDVSEIESVPIADEAELLDSKPFDTSEKAEYQTTLSDDDGTSQPQKIGLQDTNGPTDEWTVPLMESQSMGTYESNNNMRVPGIPFNLPLGRRFHIPVTKTGVITNKEVRFVETKTMFPAFCKIGLDNLGYHYLNKGDGEMVVQQALEDDEVYLIISRSCAIDENGSRAVPSVIHHSIRNPPSKDAKLETLQAETTVDRTLEKSLSSPATAGEERDKTGVLSKHNEKPESRGQILLPGEFRSESGFRTDTTTGDFTRDTKGSETLHMMDQSNSQCVDQNASDPSIMTKSFSKYQQSHQKPDARPLYLDKHGIVGQNSPPEPSAETPQTQGSASSATEKPQHSSMELRGTGTNINDGSKLQWNRFRRVELDPQALENYGFQWKPDESNNGFILVQGVFSDEQWHSLRFYTEELKRQRRMLPSKVSRSGLYDPSTWDPAPHDHRKSALVPATAHESKDEQGPAPRKHGLDSSPKKNKSYAFEPRDHARPPAISNTKFHPNHTNFGMSDTIDAEFEVCVRDLLWKDGGISIEFCNEILEEHSFKEQFKQDLAWKQVKDAQEGRRIDPYKEQQLVNRESLRLEYSIALEEQRRRTQQKQTRLSRESQEKDRADVYRKERQERERELQKWREDEEEAEMMKHQDFLKAQQRDEELQSRKVKLERESQKRRELVYMFSGTS